MDLFATSFTFPRPDSHSFSNYSAGGVGRSHNYASLIVHDTLPDRAHHIVQNVTRAAMELHGCIANFTNSGLGTYNFYLSGSYQQVTNARAMIIRECPIMVRVPLKVTRADLSSAPIRASSALRPDFHDRMNQISRQTLTQISVHPVPPNGISASPQYGSGVNGNGNKSGGIGYFGLETDRVCDVVIVGASDQVDVARIRCLVAIDEFSGLHADACEIDHKLQPIVAGIKRNFIQGIQESTNTNIYMPFLLQGLSGPQSPPLEPLPGNPGAPRPNQNVIWITGESFSVQRAKDMLLQAAATVTKTVISLEATLIPRKLDWMLTEKMEELRVIMRDNGTYIKFPAIGSVTSTITVLGTNRVHVQRTIRFIMQLACQYYTATVWMLPQQYNIMMPPMQIGPHLAQIEHILRTISCNSGAEVVFKNNTVFEVHGLDRELINALSLILELDLVKSHRLEIHIRLELAVDQREFISGKKNGKLNKIHQMCGCKIKYETLNDYNFLIDIAGPDNSVLQGLELLQGELPSEISFHVPETYHKRIIGVGGRSIQRIMKKYGVYVKFSNADEFAALGGYNDNMDNVVARTPRKNASNLELLKQAVLEVITMKDRDYIHEAFTVPRKYHRMLLGEKAPFIHDIEKQTNCIIRFPDKEVASDMIDIFGPEGPVSTASSMLMEHVPYEADWSVPACSELPALLARPEWVHFTDRIKTDVEVNIAAFPVTPSPAQTPRGGDPRDSSPAPLREHFFRLRCQRSHKESINAAKEYLEEFLLQHNVPVYSNFTGGAHRRNDSFADAFPHFNSKVLSSSTTAGHVPDSPDYNRHPEILPGPPVAGRLRLAASNPDVKGLYNSGAYMYQMNEKLPDHDEQPEDEISSQGDKYWRPSLLGPPPVGVPLHKTRHQPEPKRGSDSLINAKFTKTRSFANRAQSLDLTYSLARVTEAGNRMPRPNSPTESTIDTGATPSPTTGTSPSFPTMYAPPVAGTFGPGVVSGHRQAQSIDAAAAEHEDITRVISGLKM